METAKKIQQRRGENDLLCKFSKYFHMDGDIMRCQECGRGVIYSKKEEMLAHRAGCSFMDKTDNHPWQWIKRLLST